VQLSVHAVGADQQAGEELMSREFTLIELLRRAVCFKIPSGRVYLKAGPITADSPCVWVLNGVEPPPGYTVEGIEGSMLNVLPKFARVIQDPPSDEALVEVFVDYLREGRFLVRRR
jgi:hypothetical protein